MATMVEYSSSCCCVNTLPVQLQPVFLILNDLLCYTGNRFLKHLCVKGNSYDSGSNDSLAEMLASNKTLTDLNLSSCKLGGKFQVIMDRCNRVNCFP